MGLTIIQRKSSEQDPEASLAGAFFSAFFSAFPSEDPSEAPGTRTRGAAYLPAHTGEEGTNE